MTTIAERKLRLEKRMADLTGRLRTIEEELDSHIDPDWDELATVREGDEVLEEIGLSGQQELRMIRAALTRIRQGTYGTCARCGGVIEGGRLDAVPATPFCRACAAENAEEDR